MKFDLSNVKLSYNDIKRGLTLPKAPSKELAEFVGIMTGDGCMNYYPHQHKYVLWISGDKRLDKEYLLDYVGDIARILFNIEPSFQFAKNENTLSLRIISKGLILYLENIGFKKGRKEQIGIPDWILENEVFMVAFLQGLYDTDGSLMLVNKPSKKSQYYPIVALKLKSKPVIRHTSIFLERSGFRVNHREDDLRKDKRGYKDTYISSVLLSGRKNLDKWMKEISFRNSRHLNKYEKYLLSLRQKSGTDEI